MKDRTSSRQRLLTGLFLLMLTTFCLPTVVQAQVRALLDRQQIQRYESVELRIEIDERTSDEPDFSLLQNDFDVSQSQQRSSIRVINGQMSATSQWVVTLTPKRSGTLTIPSFTLGGQQTPELMLDVSDQAAQDPATNDSTHLQTPIKNPDPVFLLLEFSNPKPYVQEPILATLKIYHAVTILQGGLSDWAPNNARIQRVPGQTESSDTIDGKPYQITQVYYWITPQQSGTLTLPSVVFQAEIADSNRGGLMSPFGALSSQRITQATPPQNLQVRPQPANYPANTPWLPAKRVEIQDSWTPSSQQVQVGQAITRSLTVQVTGQWGSLIPTIEYPAQASLKFYPDQSPPQDQMTEQAVTGSKTLSIAMVPTKAGDLNLPTEKLTWWNTQTDQLETTEIAAARLTVLPAPGQSLPAEPSPQTGTANNAEDTASTRLAPTNSNQPQAITAAGSAPSFWQWLAIGFAGLWLLTLLLMLWLFKRTRPVDGSDADDSAAATVNSAQAIEQLKISLAANDLAAIERAVILWGQVHFQDLYLLSLGDLQKQTDNERLQQLLQQLTDQRYNPKTNPKTNSKTNPQTNPQAHSTASDASPTATLDALVPLLKSMSKAPKKKKKPALAPLPELYPR